MNAIWNFVNPISSTLIIDNLDIQDFCMSNGNISDTDYNRF